MTIIIDTREQTPLDFGADVQVTRGTLHTGDYSAPGLEDRVVVERKSLADLTACVSHERERFWRELERLAVMMSAIVVEAPFRWAWEHRYRADVHPNALIASCMAIQYDYLVPVIWAGDRESAARWILAFLKMGEKRYGETKQKRSCGQSG